MYKKTSTVCVPNYFSVVDRYAVKLPAGIGDISYEWFT